MEVLGDKKCQVKITRDASGSYYAMGVINGQVALTFRGRYFKTEKRAIRAGQRWINKKLSEQ